MNKPPDQIVAEVDELVKQIWSNWDNPENLSALILKVSVLYAPLGNYLAEARDEARGCERILKFEAATQFLAHKHSMTVAEAERQVTLDMVDRQHDLDDANKRKDILTFKREDVEKIIDAARSRLSLIKGDIQRG